MKKKILFLSIICVWFSTTRLHAQTPVKVAALTADSLASGNYKDVLTSFFQLAFDKLTGKNKELKFSSNPYAIMLRANPELAIDSAYIRHKVLRNLNFNFSLKLDTSYKFNGFSSGVTYAIVNRRDYTVYNEFLQAVNDKNAPIHRFNEVIGTVLSGIDDEELANKLEKEGNQLFQDDKFLYSKLSPGVKHIIDSLLALPEFGRAAALINANPTLSFRTLTTNAFDSIKKLFQNKLLWTASVADTTYKDNFLFSNIVFSSQLLKGISDPSKRSNVEIDIRTAFNLLGNTTRTGRDLKRSIFSFEPGLNWVLKSREDKPMLEFKFNGSYKHIFNGLYPGEEENKLEFQGTVRVRVLADIWVPLQFTYDPKKGNVLGFLSVRFNFNGQGKN